MWARNHMIFQLRYLGFTEEEATVMQKIFESVGINKLSRICPGYGEGIDKLQSFVATVAGEKIYFTVEKRKLFFIGCGDKELYSNEEEGK